MTTSNKTTALFTENFTVYLNEGTASGCMDTFTSEELEVLAEMPAHINSKRVLKREESHIGFDEGTNIYIRRCMNSDCPTELARAERDAIFNKFYNAGLIGLGENGKRKFVYIINAMKEAFGKKPVFRNTTVGSELHRDQTAMWTNINKLFGDVWKKRNPGKFSNDFHRDIARMKIEAFKSLERYKELMNDMYVGEAVQFMSNGAHDELANNYRDHWDADYDYRRGEQILCCPHCGSEEIVLQSNGGVDHESSMMTNDDAEDSYIIDNKELDFLFVYDSGMTGDVESKDEDIIAYESRKEEWNETRRQLWIDWKRESGQAAGFMELCKEMGKQNLPLQFPQYNTIEEIAAPRIHGRKKVMA